MHRPLRPGAEYSARACCSSESRSSSSSRSATAPAGLCRARSSAATTTNITNDVVVNQIKAVAKLVSSEATVRDVIIYENTWYGSTKRSLVVVTGRLLAGIDLRDNPDVIIDHAARAHHHSHPPSEADRGGDSRHAHLRRARRTLESVHAGGSRRHPASGARAAHAAAGRSWTLLRHANDSAVELLRLLLAKDGYTVDVAVRGA